MRFHLTMIFVVIAVSLGMHAMASAATPAVSADPARTERYDSAVRQAGEVLNGQLTACRDHAKAEPKASKRDLRVCERTARRAFSKDVKDARADMAAKAR